MKQFSKVLRYICSLSMEPIARATIRVIRYGARFQCAKIGKWTFAGSPDFLKLVSDARLKLRNYDPEIMEQMTDSITVMHLGNEISCAPFWGYFIISDAYVAWGDDGVLAAWVYFIYLSMSFRRNRWALADAEKSIEVDIQARRKAAGWLQKRQFPDELCRVIGVREK